MSAARTRSAPSHHPAMAHNGSVEGVARAPRRRTRATDPLVEETREDVVLAGFIPGGPNTRSRKRRATPAQAASAPSLDDTPSPPKKKRARQKAGLKKPPPAPAAVEAEEDKKPSAVDDNCCICMCEVEPDDLALVNGCDHRFCFGCIEKWAERENSCPLCKVRFTKIDRLNKKRKKGMKNTKKVKNRDQRSDLIPGAALEGLLGRIIENSRLASAASAASANNLTELLSSANFASRQSAQGGNIARLIFSATNSSFELASGPARLRSAPQSNPFRDESTGSWSSDEEETPLANFLRAFSGPNSMMHVVRPVSLTHRTAHFAAAAATTSSRSYATNHNDSNAGRNENPLNIDDSDSDDDIEVVQVRRAA